jgi:hypothetical protein
MRCFDCCQNWLRVKELLVLDMCVHFGLYLVFRGYRFFKIPQDSFAKPNTKKEYSETSTVQSTEGYKDNFE